jgi:hypothetical protein
VTNSAQRRIGRLDSPSQSVTIYYTWGNVSMFQGVR